jgi:predicted  nucleic acid-binding Zn-ribbon protein
MLSHTTKFSFATIFLAVMISVQIILPFRAHAQLVGVPVEGSRNPVAPTVTNASNPITDWKKLSSTDWLLKYILNPLARAATRAVLTALTQQVVNWISADGGNNVGFVGNFEQTLTNELDNAAGEFLDQISHIDFCGDIGAYLKINLRLPAGGFRQRARCSLTAIVKNVQNFYDNFQNGGWEAFLKTNVDIQNNTAGAFLIALDAKIAHESRRKEEFVARYSKSGILGISQQTYKQCFSTGGGPPPPPRGYQRAGSKPAPPLAPGIDCVTTYDEQTPGTIIEQTIKDANKTGIDFGIAAKDFDEAIGAIMTALLKRTISSASGIFGQSRPGQTNYGDPLYDYKEIPASQDSLRSRVDAGLFLAYGTQSAIDASVLALRTELTAVPPPSASREAEIKSRTADLLAKKQTVTAEENEVITMKQSSFNAVTQLDIAKIDQRVTQSLNVIEPITAEVRASPYVSPTGDMKTDTLNNLSGARTKAAGAINLANRAIIEIDRAIVIFNNEITAAQAQLAVLQPQLAVLQAQLAGFQTQLSALQSQLAGLEPRLAALQSQRDALQAQLASLQAQLLTATQAQTTTIQQQIAVIQTQIALVQTQINTVQGQISVIQTQINATQAQIAVTQGQITTAQGLITTTSEQINNLNATILADQGYILALINYRATLTTGSAGQKAILAQLQEVDSNLQREYTTIQRFVTTSEVFGETGNAINIIFAANDIQRTTNAAIRDIFGFLDSVLGKSKSAFQASPAVDSSGPLPIPPPIDEPPPLPPIDTGGQSGE